MDNEYVEAEEIFDEILAEEMGCNEDEAYERYRDMWCDSLYDDLKKVYEDNVKSKNHGYYSNSVEKFLEHTITALESITDCKIRANDGRILATKNVGDTHEVSAM